MGRSRASRRRAPIRQAISARPRGARRLARGTRRREPTRELTGARGRLASRPPRGGRSSRDVKDDSRGAAARDYRLAITSETATHPATTVARKKAISSGSDAVAAAGKRPRPSLTAADFSPDNVRLYLGVLFQQGVSRASAARKLAAIRTFARWLRREGIIEQDPSALAASPKREQTIPAHLSIDEMNRLLEMPDRATPLGRRDQAILELFYASGLRLSELVGLDLDDLNLNARMVRVLGKGRKERLVPLNQSAADAIRAYMVDRAQRWLEGARAAGGEARGRDPLL